MATQAQKTAAQDRRARMRALSARLAGMTEAERLALMERHGTPVRTIEGRELSMGNTLLIVSQLPGASVVGGFRQWKAAGRMVRKGEHGAGIWCRTRPAGEPEPVDDGTVEAQPERPGYVLGTVFDIGQTEVLQ